MTDGAGVLRSAASLDRRGRGARGAARRGPRRRDEHGKTAEPGVESWETTNLLCVARVLVAAALRREETRGCHWREDHPERDDAAWRRHLVVRLRRSADDRDTSVPSDAPPRPPSSRHVRPSRRPQGAVTVSTPEEHVRSPWTYP